MNLPRAILRLLLGKRLPKTSGELTVRGISQPVTIRRDAYGIPYIEAKNSLDAWYGLGFCQGQDRAFQLEMLARAASGRLAELVGEEVLPMDRLSRRIGFRRAAVLQEERLGDEDRQMIAAFAEGVSEGATMGSPKPPHEYILLRSRPLPLGVVDILAGFNYISFALSSWTAKLSRLLILQYDGPAALEALDEDYAEWLPATKPVATPSGPTLNRLHEDLIRLTSQFGIGGASNNWALNSSRTETGRPILANDPHLASTLPAPWYLASLRTPQWAVAGASFVGAPLIPAGHNDVAAWGVTAGLADNIDLFLEELGPDGCSAKVGESFAPCEVVKETIIVKGKSPVVEEVLITRHGPVISPAIEAEAGVISMRAVWMTPGSLTGLARYHQANNFEEFRHAAASSNTASLNMVFADTADNIGWQLVGEVPKRKAGWGTVPAPGWEREFDWLEEAVPFEQMPFVYNPAMGFVATANNKPTAGDDPYLGMDWVEGYRLARIVESLGESHNWNLADSMSLQLDQLSIPWREMRDAVLSVTPIGERARKGIETLASWDGTMAADSHGAAVFGFFLGALSTRMAHEKAPKSAEWVLGKGFNPMVPRSFFGLRRLSQMVRLLREQPEEWFEESWASVISGALDAAHRQLELNSESKQNNWGWGHVRPLTLIHPLGTRSPLDKVYNSGPFPWGGDGQTVSACVQPLAEPASNPTTIANLRMVLDVGNWEENLFVLAGGQSGNPFSPHYSDLLGLWKRGEGVAIAWSPESVARVSTDILRLKPLTTRNGSEEGVD